MDVQEGGHSWEQQGGKTREAAAVIFYMGPLGLERIWGGGQVASEGGKQEQKGPSGKKGPFGKGRLSRGEMGLQVSLTVTLA